MAKSRFVYKGIEGLPSIAKKAGVQATKLQYLVGKGLTIEQAVKEAARQTELEFHVIYDGEIGLEAIAKAKNFSLHTLKHRVLTQGMTIKEALKEDTKTSKKMVEPDFLESKRGIVMPNYRKSPALSFALGIITRSEFNAYQKRAAEN